MAQHRVILDRMRQAFNARRFEDLGETMDEHVLMVLDGRPLRGRSAVCDYTAAVVRELPGVHREPERILSDNGDEIVARTRFIDASTGARESSSRGDTRLPFGLLEVYRIGNGRIVEWRLYPDAAAGDEPEGGLAAQAGAGRLVAEQAALRRVATLVARGAQRSEVFDAIVSEAAGLLDESVALARSDGEDATTVLAQCGDERVRDLTGVTVSRDGAPPRPLRFGGPSRVDSYAGVTGPVGDLARSMGVIASVAVPVIVQDRVWGGLVAFSQVGLAPGTEDRLAQFAELAAVAIANTQSRTELRAVAEEQAALRRVAELVARGAATEDVFDQVVLEAERLLGNSTTTLLRYDDGGTEGVVLALTVSATSRQRPDFTSSCGTRSPASRVRSDGPRSGAPSRPVRDRQLRRESPASNGSVHGPDAASVSAPTPRRGAACGEC